MSAAAVPRISGAGHTVKHRQPGRLTHLCHVITGLGRGGAETMLVKLVEAARQAAPQLEQEVISLGDEGVYGAPLRALGVRLTPLRLRGVTALLGGVPALRSHFATLPAGSVVQSWMYHADLLCALALLGRRAPPLLWNVRQTGLRRADVGTATRTVVRACGWLANRVPRAIVSNSTVAIEAHARWGYPRPRFVVIPNGFDTAQFSPDAVARERLRRAWGASANEVLIGLVARVDPQKDHATFVAAAAQLRARRAVRFVLAGRHADDDVGLTRLIGEHPGLAERFIRLPDQADVPALMNALDVACLSSRAEGFPNVLGEAMACATPVVSTAAGDAAAILADPGRTVPPGDAPALARALERLADMGGDERQALGQRDRLRVQREYDIAAVWQRYEQIYQSVLEAPTPHALPGAATS